MWSTCFSSVNMYYLVALACLAVFAIAEEENNEQKRMLSYGPLSLDQFSPYDNFYGENSDDRAKRDDSARPGLLRFGKRDIPGVLRFGKRSEMPGVLRFGKRSIDSAPGLLRFGKRSSDFDSNPGLLRFGKKSSDFDSAPGLLRFGRK